MDDGGIERVAGNIERRTRDIERRALDRCYERLSSEQAQALAKRMVRLDRRHARRRADFAAIAATIIATTVHSRHTSMAARRHDLGEPQAEITPDVSTAEAESESTTIIADPPCLLEPPSATYSRHALSLGIGIRFFFVFGCAFQAASRKTLRWLARKAIDDQP